MKNIVTIIEVLLAFDAISVNGQALSTGREWFREGNQSMVPRKRGYMTGTVEKASTYLNTGSKSMLRRELENVFAPTTGFPAGSARHDAKTKRKVMASKIVLKFTCNNNITSTTSGNYLEKAKRQVKRIAKKCIKEELETCLNDSVRFVRMRGFRANIVEEDNRFRVKFRPVIGFQNDVTSASVNRCTRQTFDFIYPSKFINEAFGSTNPFLASCTRAEARAAKGRFTATYEDFGVNESILQTLKPISGRTLTQVGTPANKALDWIGNRDGPKRDTSDPRFIQRFVTAVFYYATGGDGWRDCHEGKVVCRDPNSASYLSPADECSWFGNGCKDGMITKLYFGTSIGNDLNGTIPSELASLPELESLFLQNSRLRGTIPTELGKLKKLHTIVVTNNLLESPFPDAILDNRLMGTIFIERNKFSGPFPPKFAIQPDLKLLLAYENEFTGTIDSRFGRLTQLQALELGHNQLVGTVPAEIASISSLENFNVDNNNLEGGFPEEIFAMTMLKQLNLTGNSFEGTIPPSVGNMGSAFVSRQKKYLNLAENRFSGSIPPEVAEIPDLKELTLHGNSFNGTIPASICDLETSSSARSWKFSKLTSDCAEVDCSCSNACECFP